MADTAVAKRDDWVLKMLEKYKPAISEVLPKHLTPEKMIGITHKMMHRTPALRNCTPVSLLNAIIEISILGLEVGRTAHIIPFKKEAVVIVDYKGMIELAHRSEKVSSTPMKAVYENDFFNYEEGTSRFIKHKPAKENRGKLVYAYAIVNFKDGSFDFEVVSQEDINATKKRAPGAKKPDSPWNTADEWTMWCKTAMRRLAKRVPQSPELQKAAYLEELVEAGLRQGINHVTDTIEAEFSTVPMPETDTEQVKKDLEEKLGALSSEGQTQEIPKTKDFDYLKKAGELKKKIKELNGNYDAYYKWVGVYGFEHSNEITDKKAQEDLLRDLGSYLEAQV